MARPREFVSWPVRERVKHLKRAAAAGGAGRGASRVRGCTAISLISQDGSDAFGVIRPALSPQHAIHINRAAAQPGSWGKKWGLERLDRIRDT
eukprot:4747073-Prymnesium_polylepis.1